MCRFDGCSINSGFAGVRFFYGYNFASINSGFYNFSKIKKAVANEPPL